MQIGMIGPGRMGPTWRGDSSVRVTVYTAVTWTIGSKGSGSSRAGRFGPSRPIRKESATLADKEENHVTRIDRYK